MEIQTNIAVESCRATASACKECAAAMQESGSEACIRSCLDCAMICEFCVSLGENDSPYFKKSLNLAMEACKDCISVCENNATASCMKCAWHCRKAITELLEYVK